MKVPSELYNDSLSTLTDLYQLTMAYGYWKQGVHEMPSAFHLFFRKNPFKGNFAIMAGTEYIFNFLENFHFSAEDLEYISTIKGNNGEVIFPKEFLNYLRDMKFTCTVDAIPEGTLVFPNEPLIRIIGPIIQCQLLETALLNIINFQTLIATKAARVVLAAKGDKVAEFGLRRAQGIDGGLAASRACYIGGCHSTSNVLAGKLFGIPVGGTHAHSWVMSFPNELESFRAYANAMPNNCTFLVDTYNVRQGILNAIIVGKELQQKGYEMAGIRLDSGDLAAQSIMAREMLNTAGLNNVKIVASNDLDEYEIARLKELGARIDIWGVGTSMVTSKDQSALGGVYKLGAIKNGVFWTPKIKISADEAKTTNPGILDVIRFESNSGMYIGDMLSDKLLRPIIFKAFTQVVDRFESDIPKTRMKFLLKSLFINGKSNYQMPAISESRDIAKNELTKIIPERAYPVGLEKELYNRKLQMMERK